MKKGIKLSAATVMAISAITPVAAFAAETEVAQAGYYTNGDFFPVSEFTAKTKAEKRAFIQENIVAGALVLVLNGKVYDLTDEKIQNAKAKEVEDLGLTPEDYTTKTGKVLDPEKGIVDGSPILKVDSVSAINGSTLEIKFNAAVSSDIIDASGTPSLLDVGANVITLNGTDLDGEEASLSEDGKTLTIYEYSGLFDGSYTVRIAGDEIPGKAEGTWVAESKSVITFDDTIRPNIVKVTPVSKYVFDVEFSEPIASGHTPTASYASNGTTVNVVSSTLRNFNKTARVVLNSSTDANKDIKLSFTTLTDAVGNIAAPTSTTVKVSEEDQVAPTLVSTKALSAKVIEFKFSKKLSAVTKANIKFNGAALGASDTVALKNGDATTVVLTLNTATTLGTAPVAFAVGAVTDLNDNDNEALSALVNFSADKTGPELVSSKVLAGSPNQLKLVFNEAIEDLPGADVDAYYIDTFGVKRTLKIESTTIALDSTDTTNKTVLVDLTDDAATALEANVDYTIEFAEGDFTDAFGNDAAAFDVNFNNNGSATTTKLKVASISEASAGVIEVEFDQAVNPATATNIANYTVEGAIVKKATLTDNSASGATVELELEDGTVEVSGNYNVTVKNVKGFYTSIVAMSTLTNNIQITENVRPTVKFVVVDEFDASPSPETTVTLTFSEVVSNVSGADNTDYKLYVDGKLVTGATVAVVAVAVSSEQATLTVTINQDLSDEIASGKVVTLEYVTGNDIKDENGNAIGKDKITIK